MLAKLMPVLVVVAGVLLAAQIQKRVPFLKG
jgi:hypothetical protein